MIAPTCAGPIDLAALIAYWLGELPPSEEAPLEAHFFGCAHCASRLEEIAALASGIRAVLRAGTISAMITLPLLEAMRKAGLKLREYRVAPGGRVDCTIRADEDAVVSRMQVPLAGVTRVDAVQTVEEGLDERFGGRIEDIPFDAAAGEVLFVPCAAALKKMPANTFLVRLLAVDDSGERALGDYTFVHTPS